MGVIEEINVENHENANKPFSDATAFFSSTKFGLECAIGALVGKCFACFDRSICIASFPNQISYNTTKGVVCSLFGGVCSLDRLCN